MVHTGKRGTSKQFSQGEEKADEEKTYQGHRTPRQRGSPGGSPAQLENLDHS